MNKLYLMVGYPGSGKSTILKQILKDENDLVLSSDDLREELFGFQDQTRNNELFIELYRRAENHKDKGNVYIDSTALTKKDRARCIERLKEFFEVFCINVLRPIDELIAVNKSREGTEKHIPDDKFRDILKRYQMPTYQEGFEKIYFKINSSRSDMKEAIFDYNSLPDVPHDNPHHPESIKEHIDLCIKHCLDTYKADILRDLSYYHDLGKFFVKQYNPEKGYSQTIGHPAVSAYIYLVDAIIHYMIDYNKQQNIEGNTFDRLLDIYSMNNIKSVIQMYYLVYYHDQPYACPNHDQLVRSLNKQSKPLYALARKSIINMDAFVILLEEFNKIDSLR